MVNKTKYGDKNIIVATTQADPVVGHVITWDPQSGGRVVGPELVLLREKDLCITSLSILSGQFQTIVNMIISIK